MRARTVVIFQSNSSVEEMIKFLFPRCKTFRDTQKTVCALKKKLASIIGYVKTHLGPLGRLIHLKIFVGSSGLSAGLETLSLCSTGASLKPRHMCIELYPKVKPGVLLPGHKLLLPGSPSVISGGAVAGELSAHTDQ